MPWVSTTVSSTPCWKSERTEPCARLFGRLNRAWGGGLWLAALVLALCCACLPGLVRAEVPNAEVTQLRLERADDGVYLNAGVQFTLPTLVEEVLEKGIAIYFVAEAEMFRERWYWTDRKVAQAARYMRLAYQPLTRRWRLNVSPVPLTNSGFGTLLGQNFDTLDDALDAVKRIGRLRMGDAADIGEDSPFPVVFRFRLDTSQLPRPFQIGVVGHSDWNIAVERNARLPMEKAK
jgi:hypothetical protein